MPHVVLNMIFPPALGCDASAKEVLSTAPPAEVQGGVKSLSTSTIRHSVSVLKLFYQKELLFSWHL